MNAYETGESPGHRRREAICDLTSLWPGISSCKHVGIIDSEPYNVLHILFDNYKFCRCFPCVKYLYTLFFILLFFGIIVFHGHSLHRYSCFFFFLFFCIIFFLCHSLHMFSWFFFFFLFFFFFFFLVLILMWLTILIISSAAVLVKGGMFLLLENTFQLASLNVNA